MTCGPEPTAATPDGRGAKVLSAGPSGTGRITAAEVLAAELRRSVRQSGLADVVSRYLGEPAKTPKSFMLLDTMGLGVPGEVDAGVLVNPNELSGEDSSARTNGLWVFAYGSLVTAGQIEGTIGRPTNGPLDYKTARLRGFRRRWNAGMRNRHADLTDKHYELPDGTRPNRTVSALGLETDPDSSVNGVAFRVTRAELSALDRRERRYRRMDCSSQVVAESPIPGQVFTYTPLESAMRLTAASQADGSDTISEDYKRLVEEGFESLGPEAHAAYVVSTDAPTSPVMPLRIRYPD